MRNVRDVNYQKQCYTELFLLEQNQDALTKTREDKMETAWYVWIRWFCNFDIDS